MVTDILAWVTGLPLVVVIPFFWCGAMLRSNATYWLGRGASLGLVALLTRTRAARGLPPAPTLPSTGRRALLQRRAERLVRVLGPLAVTCGFLTVGLQSAIMLSAGAVRMPLRRFIPATVLGALLWATLYGTVGMAALRTWFGWLAGSWWGWLSLLLAAALLVGVSILADALIGRLERRRAARVSDPQTGQAPALDI